MADPAAISLIDVNGWEIAGSIQPFRGHDQEYLWEGHEMPLTAGVTVTGIALHHADGQVTVLPVPYARTLDEVTDVKATLEMDGWSS